MLTNKSILHSTSEKDLNRSFFEWLFESDNIKLYCDEDPLPIGKMPIIYYTQELKDFFDTLPMQRLKRILQLGKFVDNNSSALHTRYEHSIGVYNLKKNIILQQFINSSDFKIYVEKNHLKTHLIAELIKSAAHDIGHLPLSHTLELSVIQKPGFHEEIGKRILLEHTQIYNCLYNISPELPSALKDTLEHDYFGFKLLDEGNYDIDRFDYMYRDLAFNGKPENKEFEPFQIVKVKCKNSVPETDSSGKIILAQNEDENTTFIPVFNISSLPSIEEFMKIRIQSYKDSYFHPITEIRDKSVATVINRALNEEEPNGKNIQVFLNTLKNLDSADDVDIYEWLSWNDLNFYNELLDIAEFSEDKALQKATIFALPGLEQLFDMSAKMLGLNNISKPLSQNDKAFLKRLHRYLHEKTDFTNALSDINYWNKCIKFTSNPEKIHKLLSKPELPVEFHKHKLVAYDSSEPIFIQTEDGKIYKYDNIPGRPPRVDNIPIEIEVAFCFIPFLEETQKKLQEKINNTLDEKNCFSFGIPYINRPSPSGMYIEKACKIEEER